MTDSISKFIVESGIPLVKRGIRTPSYPFHSMEVGDSFEVDEGQMRDRVCSAVTQFQHTHAPMKFTVRLVDPVKRSYRCWRVR